MASCELEPSSDGSLYGFWHLESIDSIEGGTADLRDQLEKVLKGLPESQRKPRLRGRFLKNSDELKVRLDERDGTISVLMTLDIRSKNYVQRFNAVHSRARENRMNVIFKSIS